MPSVLLLCPQKRDLDEIAAAGLRGRYAIRTVGTDLDAPGELDPAALLQESEAVAADGVVATKDRSALLAAVVAARRGLRGPPVEAVVRCQHKLTSRAIQREVAPDATPGFALLDGTRAPLAPPFFAKPVVGRLSQNARRIDDPAQLADLPAGDDYARGWARIAALAGPPPEPIEGYLAEELLAGEEVTVEGFVYRGRATVVGVTDSVKYPETNSFWRFEYPSRHDDERQEELGDLAARVALAHGLDDAFFNVELTVPERGQAGILELNGRIASQFAPLQRALHGRSTYDALFALACGRDPAWPAAKPDGVAISYVMRVFSDAFVERVPEPQDGLEVLVRPGARLSEQAAANDAFSYRLAILYGAGETREEAVVRCRERAERLGFVLAG